MAVERSPDLAGLGRCIRTRRRMLQLTQVQLAERMGWAQERISTIENGKYGLPSLPHLVGLAGALELPLTDLIIACGYGQGMAGSAMGSLGAVATRGIEMSHEA